jgi:hypothetical protein
MTVDVGPNLITDGLEFIIDERNTTKSWIGPPITNQFLAPTPIQNGNVTFAIQGTGTFKRITGGTYGGYSIGQNDVVYRYDLGLTGCHYHGNAAAVPSGVYVTWTFDYYISPDAANFPTVNYLANVEGPGSMAITLPNSNKGVWQSIKRTSALTTSSANSNLLLYPGACGSSYLASSGYILYKNPQVTFTTYNPTVAIPFVNGTRSTTQAILEMKENRTITASNVVYNANNTFSFNGTSSSLNFSTTGFDMASGQTIIMILKPTEADGNRRNPYNHAYGGFGTITHETGGTFSYYHGTNGGNGAPYQGTSSSFTVAQNELAMITVSRGSANVKWYKNGVLNTTTTNQYPVAVTSTSTANIGSGYAGFFQGDIEFAALYNRQLSDVEVKTVYDSIRVGYGI